MKQYGLLLSILLSLNVSAECKNHKDYSYNFQYDKSTTTYNIEIKRKDNQDFYFYGKKNNLDYYSFGVWYEVKENEITINKNIKNKNNEEFFDVMLMEKYNKNNLQKTKEITLKVNMSEWVKKKRIRYLNEKREIIPYVVIFQDDNFGCSYFEGDKILLNLKNLKE